MGYRVGLAFCWIVAVLIAALSQADEALVKVDTGEIIVVKPNGSAWGTMETNGVYYVVKHIKDEKITYGESSLVVYPYATYTNHVHRGRTNRVVSVVSRYKIDPKADDDRPLDIDGPSFATNVVVTPSDDRVVEEPVKAKKP